MNSTNKKFFYSIELRSSEESKNLLNRSFDSLNGAKEHAKEFLLFNFQEGDGPLSMAFYETIDSLDENGNILCKSSVRELIDEEIFYDGISFYHNKANNL